MSGPKCREEGAQAVAWPAQHFDLCMCVWEQGGVEEKESKNNSACNMCTHPSSPLLQLSQHTSVNSGKQKATVFDELSPSFLLSLIHLQ